MDPTCKLHSKCLKGDKSVEKCEVAECKNMIHPSCGKKLMVTFGEDEWECQLHHKKSLEGATSKTKGRVPWYNDDPVAESFPCLS